MPPRPDFARIARLAVTGLAARMQFSYDDVEDIRIGVGEICNVLLDGSGGPLVIHCYLKSDEITISATRSQADGLFNLSDLSRQILDAVLADVDVDLAQGRIDAVKRRTEEP